jgi:hypothetical protein
MAIKWMISICHIYFWGPIRFRGLRDTSIRLKRLLLSTLPSVCPINRDASLQSLSTICKATCAAKPSCTTHTLLELLHHCDIGSIDALDDQLGNSVSRLDREVNVAEVEQDHFDLSAIICINDTSAGVDAVFGS